ncbi:sigma 54-interacting transcriptional regulator [Cereibacter sphaeroides]|uniref:sigma-54-dependent Fis family transcriptional regulator n=1 Tax=Cereibacter sphaeroides TaxID=1063 RepID=UPI001F2269E2|nr:sigma 54-interacting transcriptional regulator [Cereibacter sphaeroides]MCE6949706.1 sigma 54-interacting transcriptional regulator [Cereibacter sphaeroides]
MELQTTALMRARHMLESQGRFPGGALPGEISDSWLRSLSSGLDPLARAERLVLGDTDFRTAQDRHADLIRFARPELELLFDQIAGSNFMIALGSPEGVVLETLSDTQFAETDAGRTVVPGSVWTEELRGTNALGLCLTTRRPAQVYGGEHFLRAHSDVSCISAPIFDGRGALAGVLDASSRSTVRQQHTAALVQMSASNIENCLIRSAHDQRIVLQFHPRPEYLGTLSVGMLVLEEDFTIHAINRKGEVFLAGISRLHGASFDAIFERRFEDVALRLMQGETLRLRDRMGSAVSVRCIANRASFALAMRMAPRAAPESPRGLPAADEDRNLFRDVVIEDEALVRTLRRLPEAARQGTPVFIRGETGTGKEIVARLAHAASARGGPFVAVDARMLPPGDAEAAFFGRPSEAGSGLLAQAAKGTLFVDEVTRLPLSVQAALARVLDVGEYRHPGDGSLRKGAPFLVTTSTETLAAALQDGRLLPGLRFRIEGFAVDLPPLRDRSDFDALARRFSHSARAGLGIEPEALARLRLHDWPGNLHELRLVIAQAAASAASSAITAAEVDPLLPEVATKAEDACGQCAGVPWKESQCRTIRDAVGRLGGVAQAARSLGMSRTTVYKHLTAAAPGLAH